VYDNNQNTKISRGSFPRWSKLKKIIGQLGECEIAGCYLPSNPIRLKMVEKDEGKSGKIEMQRK
jgi:hypothetical protein